MVETNPRYVTIKTILQRTGVHRQTVHYYLRRSVLPPPIRTSRTSSLYPASTVDLIQLVQALQRQQRLSLEEIVELFKTHHYDLRAIRHAVAQQPQAILEANAPQLVPLGDVMERLTPSPEREWLDRVVSSGIVRSETREGRKMLSAEGVEAIRAVWEGVRAGATLDQFQRLAQSTERQVQEEFAQFVGSLQGLSSSREAAPQVAKIFASLERFGAHRRRDALHAMFMNRLRQPGNLFLSPNRTFVFPSRTLLQQMGLFREQDLILRKLDRNPGDVQALHQLARASYLSSDWARLHTAAQEILRISPQDADAQASYGQALMYLGRLQEAVSFLEEVIARGTNPMAKIRLGQALANHAYQAGDASGLLDAVIRRGRLAAEAIRESQGNAGLNRKVRLNAILDAIYFTDPLGLNRPVEKDVLPLYEEFSAMPDRRLSVLGKISLTMARMYVTYALYLVREQNRDPKAPRLLKEIARMDPDCLLVTRRGNSAKG